MNELFQAVDKLRTYDNIIRLSGHLHREQFPIVVNKGKTLLDLSDARIGFEVNAESVPVHLIKVQPIIKKLDTKPIHCVLDFNEGLIWTSVRVPEEQVKLSYGVLRFDPNEPDRVETFTWAAELRHEPFPVSMRPEGYEATHYYCYELPGVYPANFWDNLTEAQDDVAVGQRSKLGLFRHRANGTIITRGNVSGYCEGVIEVFEDTPECEIVWPYATINPYVTGKHVANSNLLLARDCIVYSHNQLDIDGWAGRVVLLDDATSDFESIQVTTRDTGPIVTWPISIWGGRTEIHNLKLRSDGVALLGYERRPTIELGEVDITGANLLEGSHFNDPARWVFNLNGPAQFNIRTLRHGGTIIPSRQATVNGTRPTLLEVFHIYGGPHDWEAMG